MSDNQITADDDDAGIVVEGGAPTGQPAEPGAQPGAAPADTDAQRDEHGRFVAKEKPAEGEEQLDADKQPEEGDEDAYLRSLPPGVRKRVERANRKAERIAGERDAMDASLQELRDLVSKGIELKAFREPQPGDFDTAKDFAEAKERWTKVRDMIGARKDEEKPAAPDPVTEAVADLKAVVAAADPELWKEVTANVDLQITQHMVLALNETEDPTTALRALRDDPKEALRISKLGPAKQMAAILALKPAAASPPPRGPRVTAADDPPNPVSTRSNMPPVDLEKADTGTFLRMRDEEEAGRTSRFGW